MTECREAGSFPRCLACWVAVYDFCNRAAVASAATNVPVLTNVVTWLRSTKIPVTNGRWCRTPVPGKRRHTTDASTTEGINAGALHGASPSWDGETGITRRLRICATFRI
jgi:hypothetical protein